MSGYPNVVVKRVLPKQEYRTTTIYRRTTCQTKQQLNMQVNFEQRHRRHTPKSDGVKIVMRMAPKLKAMGDICHRINNLRKCGAHISSYPLSHCSARYQHLSSAVLGDSRRRVRAWRTPNGRVMCTRHLRQCQRAGVPFFGVGFNFGQ